MQSKEPPWMTRLALAVSAIIFLSLLTKSGNLTEEVTKQHGYYGAMDIYGGAYWGLITSAVVHINFLHFFFNATWLWSLGSRLEHALGSFKFTLFFIGAAFISASFELMFSENTGHGASGVVYAMFGFMWYTRHRFQVFSEVLNKQTAQFLTVWLFVCIILTYFSVLGIHIANFSHFLGLAFGVLIAKVFYPRKRNWAFLAPLILIFSISGFAMFWHPYSLSWNEYHARKYFDQRKFQNALPYLSQMINIAPDDPRHHENRGHCYSNMGQIDLANQDYQKAAELKEARSKKPEKKFF